jgi:hypothetical protein
MKKPFILRVLALAIAASSMLGVQAQTMAMNIVPQVDAQDIYIGKMQSITISKPI